MIHIDGLYLGGGFGSEGLMTVPQVLLLAQNVSRRCRL
jgi:hypothetical protein